MTPHRVLAFACLVMLLLPFASSPAAPPDTRHKEGAHFRVICHFDDEAAAIAALDTVEAVWPFASTLFGMPDVPLDPPLDVHLYRRPADYLSIERELAGGRFDRNLAFSSYDTSSSYVALQPDISDAALDATGITAQTRHNLAHEAVHLVCYRASPTFRSHPAWCSEGAAVWAEQEAMTSRGWSAGREEDPYIAADMVLAQKLLAGGRLPTAGQILRDETRDLDLYDRYAVQALLFRRLITRKDSSAFRAALGDALRIEAGPDFAKRFLAAVFAPYENEGMDALDLDFEQYVRSQKPAWDEVFRSLSTVGDAWSQAAFPDHNALAWRTAAAGEGPYELRGQLEILPGLGGVDQMNVLLGRDGAEGFVSVAFVAGYGVDVMRYHVRDDRWEKLAAKPTRAVQLWRRLPFRILVDGSKLTVRLDGTEIVSADLNGRAMKGPWGLGVQAGSAGRWRSVRVEATKR